MTVETEMMNEENGRLRRHIKTLEAELKKADRRGGETPPHQAPDCGCIGPRDCTGACCEAAVEPVGRYNYDPASGSYGIRWLINTELSHGTLLYTSPPDHTKAMRLALDALCLPCDRWNKQQSVIVNHAIAALEGVLNEQLNAR